MPLSTSGRHVSLEELVYRAHGVWADQRLNWPGAGVQWDPRGGEVFPELTADVIRKIYCKTYIFLGLRVTHLMSKQSRLVFIYVPVLSSPLLNSPLHAAGVPSSVQPDSRGWAQCTPASCPLPTTGSAGRSLAHGVVVPQDALWRLLTYLPRGLREASK